MPAHGYAAVLGRRETLLQNAPAALKPEDFTVLGQLGGAMVWSPLSNLLLYGGTANIAPAIAAGVRIGIGSDWSPSGSKNLLGELKVAWLVAQQIGGIARHDIIAR